MPSATSKADAPPPPSQSQHDPKPPTLTLPGAQFAALAPASYLTTHLLQTPPTRPSRRSPATFRTPTLQTSSLAHTHGSAVARTGGTAVVVGVTAETLLAADVASTASREAAAQRTEQDRLAELALLVPNVELSTGCAPAHAPAGGGPPSAEAQSLSVQLLRTLKASALVALDDLTIRRGARSPAAAAEEMDTDDRDAGDEDEPVAYWTLYINAVVLSLDGSAALLDTLWGATFAALADVRLPRASWDADRALVVCSDDAGEARRLQLHARPVCATWGVFQVPRDVVGATFHGQEAATEGAAGKVFVLADPDGVEERVCKEYVQLILDRGRGSRETRIVSLVKRGGLRLGVEDVAALIKEGERRWSEWDAVLP